VLREYLETCFDRLERNPAVSLEEFARPRLQARIVEDRSRHCHPVRARRCQSSYAEIDAQAGDETAHLAGNEAIAIRADVTDPDSLQSAIRATVDKFGRLEVLHNNAGGSTAQDDTAVNAIAYGPLVSTSLFSVEGHLVRATFNG
jgi:NAD(P)-dependent dehydrogenase (short-subunit alcohol dehydrogenase family)